MLGQIVIRETSPSHGLAHDRDLSGPLPWWGRKKLTKGTVFLLHTPKWGGIPAVEKPALPLPQVKFHSRTLSLDPFTSSPSLRITRPAPSLPPPRPGDPAPCSSPRPAAHRVRAMLPLCHACQSSANIRLHREMGTASSGSPCSPTISATPPIYFRLAARSKHGFSISPSHFLQVSAEMPAQGWDCVTVLLVSSPPHPPKREVGKTH